jgi:methylated-DNA-[protein]-cysteine S-methyltransferase
MIEIICASFSGLTMSGDYFLTTQRSVISSPMGNIELIETGGFLKSVRRTRKAMTTGKMSPGIKEATRQLGFYFKGKLTEFDLPIDPDGTEFQKKVWTAMAGIPYGTMWSYQQVAKKIGHPRAARAVGTANARCEMWIIIPCHRVISASGAIGGYGGSPEIKKRLLELEKASPQAPAFLP